MDVTDRIEKGHVFTAFHFPEVRTNLLIGQSADINTSCPEYKVVAVSVEPGGAGTPAPAPAAAKGFRWVAVPTDAMRPLSPPRCRACRGARARGAHRPVAVELPLEIRLTGDPLAITMRTPGHDLELVSGSSSPRASSTRRPEVGLAEDLAANVVEVCAAGDASPRRRAASTPPRRAGSAARAP